MSRIKCSGQTVGARAKRLNSSLSPLCLGWMMLMIFHVREVALLFLVFLDLFGDQGEEHENRDFSAFFLLKTIVLCVIGVVLGSPVVMSEIVKLTVL